MEVFYQKMVVMDFGTNIFMYPSKWGADDAD